LVAALSFVNELRILRLAKKSGRLQIYLGKSDVVEGTTGNEIYLFLGDDP